MRQDRILIVEDEVRVAQALGRALSMQEGGGYLVQTCESGEDALSRFCETPFDLLITDLRMPGMNGLELIAKYREVSPGIKSILITAFGSSEVEERAYQLEVDGYLAKPFSIRKLVRAVQVALGRTDDFRPHEREPFRETAKI
jgi:YesN/AraC family two-component response regulator